MNLTTTGYVARYASAIVSLLLLAVIASAFSTAAFAAELSWTLPTTRANGSALSASEISATKIYRQDTSAVVATVPAPATTYTVPDCTSAVYYGTVVDTSGLESAQSNTARNTPLAVNCAPKPPTAVTIK